MIVKKHISLYHSNVYTIIIKYVYYLKYIYILIHILRNRISKLGQNNLLNLSSCIKALHVQALYWLH